MLINGMPFTVSNIRYGSLRRLRTAAGNCTLLSQFRPVRYPHSTHIWRLLYNGFFCHGICCFLAGPFVLFMAGVFDSFTHATLFIALTDSPLIRCIFRKNSDPPSSFYIHNYLFEFMQRGSDEDILFYTVSCDDFRMRFTIYGIDASTNCDTYSNLDFINFIWDNFDRFHFVRYALTLVRRDYLSLPELVCMKYYRAESDGWRNDILCNTCISRTQTRFQHMISCLRTRDCRCTICARQPPSLLSSASNTLFRLVLEIGRFELTRETTYAQYIQAVRSYRVPTNQLLPPDFPNIRLHFRCNVFVYKLHKHCPGEGLWTVQMDYTFRSESEAVRSLVSKRFQNTYWCRHCRRGLFFYSECSPAP